MFKFVKKDAVRNWPVEISEPGDNGAAHKHCFAADFQLLKLAEADAAFRAEADGGEDFLAKVLIGWDGVMDESGAPLDFTPDTKMQLLQVAYIRTGLHAAYRAASHGIAAARKNS